MAVEGGYMVDIFLSNPIKIRSLLSHLQTLSTPACSKSISTTQTKNKIIETTTTKNKIIELKLLARCLSCVSLNSSSYIQQYNCARSSAPASHALERAESARHTPPHLVATLCMPVDNGECTTGGGEHQNENEDHENDDEPHDGIESRNGGDADAESAPRRDSSLSSVLLACIQCIIYSPFGFVFLSLFLTIRNDRRHCTYVCTLNAPYTLAASLICKSHTFNLQ